ncbi:DUF4350 domain-containing protein [Streptomyces ovatisporus]|uniref:DUF4350 domain-containing protein n=1 Tax=Streptomyces ovatisporus TaxID=1128682 RepID=A0ABV9ACY3_9ACTN
MSTGSGTSLSPTAIQLWRRARGLLLAAAVLAVAGVAIAAIRSGPEYGLLDPRSTDDHGSRAAAELLRERGIEIEMVSTSTEAKKAVGPHTTLLVSDPDALSRRQSSDLRTAPRSGGRTVLVAPGPAATRALTRGVRASAPTSVELTPPDCDFPPAERAGDAELGGVRYTVTTDQADTCYLHRSLPSLVRLPADSDNGSRAGADGGDTVLLGAPDPLYNQRLAHRGNASLMLQLLGSRPHLVWYVPSPAGSSTDGDGERGLLELLPDGWSWALLQLSFAAVLAALWRARRLGPLVSEQLPVSVRASETTEGRARLYRRADARDSASEALRSATRARLAGLLGLSAAEAHSPQALTTAVAASSSADSAPGPGTTTQPPSDATQLYNLLFGSAPPNDADLVRLADELDALERRLSHSTSTTSRPTDKERTP